LEPDIAFAGAGDNTPWVVWYETGTTATTVSPLRDNPMVFAAEGIPDGAADGGLHWQAVGNNAQGELDTSGTAPQNFGSCATNISSEESCSLNADPTANAEDPRVAAGTMNPADPTVPWVAWDESVGGHRQVFVSRLTGTGAAARFAFVNNGQPISTGATDSTRPDITFSGNTPYVSWREDTGGGEMLFVGHFVNAANPTFVLDSSSTSLTPTTTADVREPISSGCTANPFNADGATCQGGALGTPFFLFTNGTSPLSLIADSYQPDPPATGAASGVDQTTATVSGSVNPEGARTSVAFQFGTTTAYGFSTGTQTIGPDNSADAFSVALSGLAPGATIHYRAVATNDFGTEVGSDETLTTTPLATAVLAGKPSAGHARVSGTTVSIAITCKGGSSCTVSLKLTVTERLRGHRIVAVSARKAKVTRKTVGLGAAKATVKAGHKRTVRVGLNRAGRNLLAARHRLVARLTVTQRVAGKKRTISSQKVTFKARRHRKR
jgi:hypothetical protein